MEAEAFLFHRPPTKRHAGNPINAELNVKVILPQVQQILCIKNRCKFLSQSPGIGRTNPEAQQRTDIPEDRILQLIRDIPQVLGGHDKPQPELAAFREDFRYGR